MTYGGGRNIFFSPQLPLVGGGGDDCDREGEGVNKRGKEEKKSPPQKKILDFTICIGQESWCFTYAGFLEIQNPWGKVMERSGLTF